MTTWTTECGLRWRNLQPFGIEIDHDLSAPLAPETAERFVALVNEHSLVVAHRQSLTRDQQNTLVGLLGPLLERRGEDGYISNVATDDDGNPSRETKPDYELTYHSDGAYTDKPLEYLSLHAVDVIDGASSTLFVNAEHALDHLPATLHETLGSHTVEMIAPGMDTLTQRSCDVREHVPNFRGERPGISVNPHTGRRFVNVSEMNAARLLGMPWDDSRATLHEVFDHLYASPGVHEHVWQAGDLVIWDNIALQHARGPLREPGPRVLQRVIVATEGFAPHALSQEEREAMSTPVSSM